MLEKFYRWKKFDSGRHTGGVSPVRFRIRPDQGGWLVSVGRSSAPVAWGPPATISKGKEIFRHLEDEYWRRAKAKRPKARVK